MMGIREFSGVLALVIGCRLKAREAEGMRVDVGAMVKLMPK